jgi:Tfp pilus assembly protein FimT
LVDSTRASSSSAAFSSLSAQLHQARTLAVRQDLDSLAGGKGGQAVEYIDWAAQGGTGKN